jgi:ROS/MUCR transcriptional regulator protein
MRPIQLTATIVSAYVSNNTVPSAEIPALITEVYSVLMRVTNGAQVAATAVPLKPAVPINHSVTPEYIVCLEDGKKFKSHGPRSKWIEYICPKTCMARTGPAMTRRKDRYQPRAASASQPKTLKTYACARDCTPRDAIYFGARDTVVCSERRNWFVHARLRLFMLMFRNSVRAVDLFNLPPQRYVEVGRQIEI